MNPAQPSLQLHRVDKSKHRNFWSARVSHGAAKFVIDHLERPSENQLNSASTNVAGIPCD